MQFKRHVLAGLLAVAFTGCGMLGGTTIPFAVEGNTEPVKVSVDPIMYTGVLLTDAVRQGNYTVYRAIFPDGLFSNYHPIRLRYNALAYGKKTGKSYPAQAIYVGYQECEIRLAVIVEGHPDEELVIAIANTLFTRLYNAATGQEIHVKTPEKLASDAVYRRQVVLEGGTDSRLLGKPFNAATLHRDFSGWAIARVPEQVDQAVPWRKETLDRIARINPQFTVEQKCLGVCRFGFNPLSLWSTGAGVLEDLYMTSKAPSKIWDDSGTIENGFQGMLAQGIREQFQRAVQAGMICQPSADPQRRVQY